MPALNFITGFLDKASTGRVRVLYIANNPIQIVFPFFLIPAFLCQRRVRIPWTIWRLGKNDLGKHTPSWTFRRQENRAC